MKSYFKILIVLSVVVLTSYGLYQFLKTDSIYDEKILKSGKNNLKAYDEIELENDKKRMWNIVAITYPKGLEMVGLVSPNSAINAAFRVIQSEKANLLGLTLKEALAKLNYADRNPQCQIKNKNLAILQFSNVYYHLQYDLILNAEGKIESINKIEKQ